MENNQKNSNCLAKTSIPIDLILYKQDLTLTFHIILWRIPISVPIYHIQQHCIHSVHLFRSIFLFFRVKIESLAKKLSIYSIL